ncbi:MAG: bacterial transcriptional activator domain-containing protein, partial [Dehalococcoidia bacterium]|nr:bacterial transcriptional activator domain-containing protein [Dehalococcoidia bacterium]
AFVQMARHAARLVAQGRRGEAIEEYWNAAALYQGEYLEDEPYSDWCLFERERLKEVYINMMKQIGSILTEKGDLDQAIEAYHSALGVDEGREELHRELMLLLWKAGRHDEALRQHDSCRRILREELGVEPALETESLYKAMLAGTHPQISS